MTKDQIEKLIDDANLSSTASFRIREWFEKNPQEPVAVGLSDEQVDGLIQHFKDEGILQNKLNHAWIIKDYLKTQTFAIPEVQPVSALSSAYQCLLEDNLALAKELEQLKAQQFTPDWNIIPSYVDEVEIVMNYCQGGMIDDDSNFLISYKRPTPPAPKVDVGQVWRYTGDGGDDYTVTNIQVLEGKSKLSDKWTENLTLVTYESGGDKYTRPLSDFLAKFDRVQP